MIKKGGAKRYAQRLAALDYSATRQAVLTVDRQKFQNDPQLAYETIKERQAIHQFIHNLERTSKIKIIDWVWILEWYKDGFPHWYLFIQTEKGKNGKIGNKALLRHWKYGLVFESYIHSKKHWKNLTGYFESKGYFENEKKSHQLSLPEWAKQVTYSIRKMGSKVKSKTKKNKPKGKSLNTKESFIEDKDIEDEQEKIIERRTYKEILDSCGQSTYCNIRRGNGTQIWKKYNIPYCTFKKQYKGRYKEKVGYIIRMSLSQLFKLDVFNNKLSKFLLLG